MTSKTLCPKPVPAPDDIFVCQQCSECCKGYGGTYVTEKDIETIADYIGVPRSRFVEDYCQLSGNRPVLAQGKNGYCVFLKDLCSIHPVKPRMCRAWPFIETLLKAPENWHIMAGSCPGMRTDVSREQIVACVSAVLKKRMESHSS